MGERSLFSWENPKYVCRRRGGKGMNIAWSAFVSELRKLASDSRQKTRGERAKLFLARSGLATGGILGAKLLTRSLRKGERGFSTSEETALALKNRMAPGAHMSLVEAGPEVAFHIPAGGNLPRPLRFVERAHYLHKGLTKPEIDLAFREGNNFIPEQAGPWIAGHELGHESFERTRLGKVTKAVKFPLGVGAGLAAGFMASRSDPESTTAKLAPLVGAVGIAPALGEEAAASVRALRGLRALGASPEMQRVAKKQLAKAWGAYGLALGLPAVAAPYAVRKIRQYYRHKENAR